MKPAAPVTNIVSLGISCSGLLLETPDLDAGGTRGTVEPGFDVKNESLATGQQAPDQSPAALHVARVRYRQYDRICRLQRLQLRQRDAVFMAGVGRVRQGIVHLYGQTERLQLIDDIN